MKDEQVKPSWDRCYEIVKYLCKDDGDDDETLKQKANWLYLINRLSFWDDIPVLMDIINYAKSH